METPLKEGELTRAGPNTDEVQLSKPIVNLKSPPPTHIFERHLQHSLAGEVFSTCRWSDG